MSDDRLDIIFIGSGNVASSLAPALDSLDNCHVSNVYSRKKENAQALCDKLKSAEAVNDPSLLPDSGDLYIISVSDDAVGEVAVEFAGLAPDATWVHTSGSVPADALKSLGDDYGVFYPLQTFSRERVLNLSHVPFFIEGSNENTTESLLSLAGRLTDSVRIADGDTRKLMHVAAVFACNFTNHLWAIADRILATRDIPLTVLKPLLDETLRKAMTMNPADGQTGPARRNDKKVMSGHLAMLDDNDAELYRIISESIIKMYYK